MSTLPLALRNRLEQSDAADAAVAPVDLAEQIVPAADAASLLRDDGTLDMSVFEVSDSEAPPPAPVVAAESPPPLSAAQMQQVREVDPSLAAHILSVQSQVQGLVEQLAAMRADQASAERLRAQIKELEAANAQLVSARQQADILLDIPAPPGLSDEDRQLVQDPRLLGIFERIATKHAADYAATLAARVQEKFDVLERRMQEQATQATEVAQRSADASLRARVATRHPDVQGVFHDPAFAAFLKQPVPYSRSTFGQALQASWAESDADTVCSIIDKFKQERAASPPPAAQAPSAATAPPASQVPASPLAATGSPAPTAPPKLRASEYRRASALFRSGRLSATDFEPIRALYDKAAAQGRVDYTK